MCVGLSYPKALRLDWDIQIKTGDTDTTPDSTLMVYLTADGQSTRLSWYRAPLWGP
jgi:hypothetical protein